MSDRPKPSPLDAATGTSVSPALIFRTLNAFQQTEALKAAVELKIFTIVATGVRSPAGIASACGASERGVRILCDFLTILGFFIKRDNEYALTRESAVFLDEASPQYAGRAIGFLAAPGVIDAFRRLPDAVRKGTASVEAYPTSQGEPDVWVEFARGMPPLIAQPAMHIARLVNGESRSPLSVLDLAAGHGLFGIAFAAVNPKATVTAIDFASVLDVARENAQAAGVNDRFRAIPGDATAVDYGGAYDVVLITNILHNLGVPECRRLLSKARAAMNPGGRAVTVEFVPNEDRLTPPGQAAFALAALANTAAGDAYTFAELDGMFREAGFSRSEIHPLPNGLEQVIISST